MVISKKNLNKSQWAYQNLCRSWPRISGIPVQHQCRPSLANNIMLSRSVGWYSIYNEDPYYKNQLPLTLLGDVWEINRSHEHAITGLVWPRAEHTVNKAYLLSKQTWEPAQFYFFLPNSRVVVCTQERTYWKSKRLQMIRSGDETGTYKEKYVNDMAADAFAMQSTWDMSNNMVSTHWGREKMATIS